uniref:aminomethyltransferase beta-barrel domain-containing protein n=1 Tax=uncultured Micrococcus sp. TaxID=114051 RepID=UPI00345C4CFD
AQAYTVGQRKGLAIGRPAPDGRPRFVLEVRPKENTVVVGGKELLDVDRITAIRPSWAGAPLAEDATGAWFDCELQFRAHGEIAPARARVVRTPVDCVPATEAGEGAVVWEIEPARPLRGVAPGQSAVLYRGTRVLGQATIDTARNARLAAGSGA